MIRTVAMFDIDGVLADPSLKPTFSSNAEYYVPKVMRHLPPIPSNVKIAKDLCEDDSVDVVFITGRDQLLYNVTLHWLESLGLKGTLYCRPYDTEPSTSFIAQWKTAQLRSHLIEHYKDKDDHELKTLIAYEDTVENLYVMKDFVNTTKMDYLLVHITLETNKVKSRIFAKKQSVVRKDINTLSPDTVYQMVDSIEGYKVNNSRERM